MVIHKSAQRPKTNTAEPLMQGSHNMSSGWLLNEFSVGPITNTGNMTEEQQRSIWDIVVIVDFPVNLKRFSCIFMLDVSPTNRMLWLVHIQ